eukprot:1286216-Pleurochrysis_carterae.AAC.1
MCDVAREEWTASVREPVEHGSRRATCHSNNPPPANEREPKLTNRQQGVTHGGYASHVSKSEVYETVLRVPHRQGQVSHSDTGSRLSVYSGYGFRARSDVHQVLHVWVGVVSASTVHHETDMSALFPHVAYVAVAESRGTGSNECARTRSNVQVDACCAGCGRRYTRSNVWFIYRFRDQSWRFHESHGTAGSGQWVTPCAQNVR